MTERPKDPSLPWWIEQGPLPPSIPVEPKHGTHLNSYEFSARVRRAFDEHPFACWRDTCCWDRELDVWGYQEYVVSRASPGDLVTAAASQGLVERHRETRADGVVTSELLIILKEGRIASYCQLKAWLGDTPFHRDVLERGHHLPGGWLKAAREDEVLLWLLYAGVNHAADVLADDRDHFREIRNASLDERARALDLYGKLAEARALAAKLEDD
jgi:hypothetical protein